MTKRNTSTAPERDETSQAVNVPTHGVFVVEGEGDNAYWTRALVRLGPTGTARASTSACRRCRSTAV